MSDLRNSLLRRARPLLWRAARVHRSTLGRRARTVAVTGTLGKTTTARAITAVLGTGQEQQLELNRNHLSTIPLMVMQLRPWTRERVFEVAAAKTQGAVGRMARIVRPQIGVVTAIATEHLEAFHTLEGLREEKAGLVRALPEHGRAVLNRDDPHVRWMASQTKAAVCWFGFHPEADVRASEVAYEFPPAMRLVVTTAAGGREVRLQTLGLGGVYAALAATAVGLEMGRALAPTLRAIEGLVPTRGRLAPVLLRTGAWALNDDYKSAPETFHDALDVLAAIPAKRRFAVLGGVTTHTANTRQTYREVGEHVGRVADRVIVVKHTHWRQYRGGIQAAGLGPDPARATHVPTWEAAAELVARETGEGDLVLVKGRSSQRLARLVLSLSGREVRCHIDPCEMRRNFCDGCWYRTRGWGTGQLAPGRR
jgi:UDP-N-acetylmuramyl pentapeptide synthase